MTERDHRPLLRLTFDEEAERYDRIRPHYPPEVFDDIERLGRFSEGSRILEIGCGTGQATVDLAIRGYTVVAVELGPELAALAQCDRTASGRAEVAR